MEICKNKAFALKGGFIFLFLIFALRHPCMGNDLHYLSRGGYLGSFDILNQMSWKEILTLEKFLNYEKGYVVLNKLIGSIWNNRQFFMAVIAFLSIYPVYRFIKKYSFSPAISYVVYMGIPVFLMLFSGMRQIIAIAICVYAIDFIIEKKPVQFTALVLFSTLFHSSASIFLVAYPIYYLKFSRRTRWASVAMLGVVFLFRYQLFSVFSKLFKENAETTETGAFLLFLIFTAIYIFCFLFKNDELHDHEIVDGLLNIFYAACIMQSFSGIHNLAMRAGYYFMIVLVVLLPNIIITTPVKNNRKIMIGTVVLIFSVYGLYKLRESTWAQAVPYYFFWQALY